MGFLTASLVILSAFDASAILHKGSMEDTTNPVRKVVNMLQSMQKKITEEGEKEKVLHEKYMCYCKSSIGDLEKTISDAKVKKPESISEIQESESQLAQLQADVKQAQTDRASAKAAIADANAIREKEAKAFEKESTQSTGNIDALAKAIEAISKGMTGSFLQTAAAQVLRKLAISNEDLMEGERQELATFLSGTTGTQYAPASSEILGIMKHLRDAMTKELAEAKTTEEAAIKAHQELVAAKTKEFDALFEALQTKTVRIGELQVEIEQMKEDLSDTEATLLEDTKFFADLQKNCGTREKEWEGICKTRSEELLAIADTIRILNDDDALELFKKVLPSPSSSFFQVGANIAIVKEKVLKIFKAVKTDSRSDRLPIDLVTVMVKGQKVSFKKVLTMIDDMVALLKTEQEDDIKKKEYCAKEFDSLDDKKKSIERSVSDVNSAMEDAKERIAAVTAEIKAMEAAITKLDKAVTQATEQRKAENAEYKESMASNAAAKELLAFARNRLNKFYSPKVYQAPDKSDEEGEETVAVNTGGTFVQTRKGATSLVQLRSVKRHRDAPPPPPEAVDGYNNKSQDNASVIQMIDALMKDIDTELEEAEESEQVTQADYEQMLEDSKAKRLADTKALAEKTATKADMEENYLAEKDKKTAASKELAAVLKVTSALHTECDFLLKYFDVRTEARDGEIDALEKAKAVLQGADFSLMQTKAK